MRDICGLCSMRSGLGDRWGSRIKYEVEEMEWENLRGLERFRGI